MITVTENAFQRDLGNLLATTIKFNEPINISTENGSAIVISQEDFDGMTATLNLSANPQLKAKILDGKATPLDECVSEDEVVW